MIGEKYLPIKEGYSNRNELLISYFRSIDLIVLVDNIVDFN